MEKDKEVKTAFSKAVRINKFVTPINQEKNNTNTL